MFCRRSASGPSERRATEVQAEVGCRKRLLPRPNPPPSCQKATWVTFSCFILFFYVFITWALQNRRFNSVVISVNKAVKWVPLRNKTTALLSKSNMFLCICQLWDFCDIIWSYFKHLDIFVLLLPHNTVHLYPFTPPSLPPVPLSDKDRLSSAGGGAREDLCHARPHHARRRHQGPDNAVWLGRPRAGGHHRLGQTYPR